MYGGKEGRKKKLCHKYSVDSIFKKIPDSWIIFARRALFHLFHFHFRAAAWVWMFSALMLQCIVAILWEKKYFKNLFDNSTFYFPSELSNGIMIELKISLSCISLILQWLWNRDELNSIQFSATLPTRIWALNSIRDRDVCQFRVHRKIIIT